MRVPTTTQEPLSPWERAEWPAQGPTRQRVNILKHRIRVEGVPIAPVYVSGLLQ